VREIEPSGGPISLMINIISIILPGLEVAIIGFPIAVQHMKLVQVALLPFGHVMREV
tara:strand:+ start:17928 stop:18098 length:171 start_codon:yes stop_codon:yes gene_type:complete